MQNRRPLTVCHITFCAEPGTEGPFTAMCVHEHLTGGWFCPEHAGHLNLLRTGELHCSACWDAAEETCVLHPVALP